jgi:hypothetical protein
MIPAQRISAADTLFVAANAVCEGAQAQMALETGTGQESTGKHHVLPANKDTAQWGWLDPAEKPKVVVDSGDTVSIETLRHSMDEIKPGVSIEEIVKLRLANPGGGPHSVTGPIYVNGAEPGDTLEIRNVARRNLFTHFDRRRLPRFPGNGYPQGRALHDSPSRFSQRSNNFPPNRQPEIGFAPCFATAN